jgi:three-Cys-motif partner protein
LPDALRFDYYYFVDKRPESLDKLKAMLHAKALDSGRKLAFKEGDANKWIVELANAAKTQNLASLVFLDPFGMQIDWSSIEALRNTRSDIWILVPTGVIVNRLLERNGELKHINKLVSFFGMTEEEIRTAFYDTKVEQTLFGELTIVSKVSQPIDKIARLYAQRLGGVWKHVTTEPLRLTNTNGTPIFHLVFASNNSNALKIAKDIIKTV